MTQNIILKVNSIKSFLFVLFILYSPVGHGQCWERENMPSGYKLNTSYNIDSLEVAQKFDGVLNHSIALIDSLDVEQQETWLYYILKFDHNHKTDVTIVSIELRQADSSDIFFLSNFDNSRTLAGAFCYNGFTFFVLIDSKLNTPLFEELFTRKEAKDFYVFYNSPISSKEWNEMGFSGFYKWVFLFYSYSSGEFTYNYTGYLDGCK